MEALLLARIQFAANITFHILFPTITIALCWFLLFFKLRYDAGRGEHWLDAYRFWVKIFALSFALGVVSGVTMSFQFGTNWPGFMETVGNVAGPLLAYEVLTAFFLEATFLGIMLFGTGRVSNSIHTAATVLVALGTTVSAFWILALNSWMQTPAGFEMIDGKAHVTSWWGDFVHAVSALQAYPYAHRLGPDRGVPRGRRLGLSLAAGRQFAERAGCPAHRRHSRCDPHSRADLRRRSAWAEYAGASAGQDRGDGRHLGDRANAPLRLFAIPDEAARTNHYEILIPQLASWILTHSSDGEVKGLNAFQGNHPPVAPVFFAFRIMVGMGLLMLAVSWLAAWQFWRRGEPGRWLARGLVGMTFAGWIATVAGWYTTEIGRQPWLVSGVLRTADAAAPNVTAPMIGLSPGDVSGPLCAAACRFIFVVFHIARRAGNLRGR